MMSETPRRRYRTDRRSGRRYLSAASDLCSPRTRKRTPPAFARWLVDLVEEVSLV